MKIYLSSYFAFCINIALLTILVLALLIEKYNPLYIMLYYIVGNIYFLSILLVIKAVLPNQAYYYILWNVEKRHNLYRTLVIKSAILNYIFNFLKKFRRFNNLTRFISDDIKAIDKYSIIYNTIDKNSKWFHFYIILLILNSISIFTISTFMFFKKDYPWIDITMIILFLITYVFITDFIADILTNKKHNGTTIKCDKLKQLIKIYFLVIFLIPIHYSIKKLIRRSQFPAIDKR
jgi:hypothetical protein